MFRVLILSISLAFNECEGNMEGFIVGGNEAAIKKWPFIAFIEIATKDGMATAICGGSLLSSQTVLTAAHCLDDLTNSKENWHRYRYQIYMGHSRFQKATMTRTVADYETHKNYDPNNKNIIGDIGVMFLHRPVKFMRYVNKVILKRTFDIKKDKHLEVAGWGMTDPKTKIISKILKSVKVTAIPSQKCNSIINFHVIKVICAKASKEYAYSGDSGGPLVDQDKHYQAGLVSFRDQKSELTIYTSVPDYFNWIQNTQWKMFKKHCPFNTKLFSWDYFDSI